jgi:hypothetical protein
MTLILYLAQFVAIVAFLATCFTIAYVFQRFARRFVEEEEEGPKRRRNIIRGTPIGTLAEAQRTLDRNAPPPDAEPRTLFLGGLWLPRSDEVSHTFVAGTTGAGKSLLAKIQLRAALRRIVEPIGDEMVGAVVYDNKRELVPIIAGIVGMERVIILNAFDIRSFAPDFPSMYDAESLIQLLAEVYVPPRPNDPQPFFTNGPQDLITGATLVFDERAPGRWDARDQIEATSSIARLKFVLGQSSQTAMLVDTYLDTEVMSKSLIASVRAATRDFRPVAAIWARNPRKVNLKEFVENLGYVLVLQPSEAKRRVARATQRLFLQRIMEYALDLEDSDRRRLFFFLDEVQELQHIDLLPRGLSVGRSKGHSYFLYTQTRAGLVKIYGEHDTEVITDNCGNRAYLALQGRTAKWGAEDFGSMEIKRRVRSKNKSPDNKESCGESDQFQMQNVLFDNELAGIFPPSPARGLRGVYRTRLTRPFTSTLTGLDKLLPRPMPGVKGFDPRDKREEILKPWTMDDLRRLNLAIGPDDDLEAILGPQPEDTPPPTADTADGSDPGLFGKLRGFFGKGEAR